MNLDDLIKEAAAFVDANGILDSTLKRTTAVPVGELQPLLDDIKMMMFGVDYTVCGSIRRGAATARDIDLVISPKFGQDIDRVMQTIYQRLADYGMEMICSSRQGACMIAELADDSPMRVDLLFCESFAHGSGVMFMTGSKEWNDAIRLHAIRNGMEFTARFTMKYNRGHCFTTEEEAFRFLGIQYVEPAMRVAGTQILDIAGVVIGSA